MNRLVVAAALALAGCAGDTVDDRPLELDYLTQAVFAPTCGTTQCHSTFVQAAGNVFDTPEGTRRSLLGNGLIRFDSTKYDPEDPRNADLIVWITETDPFGLGIGRMPYDAPMPNKDVLLLQDWIKEGAPGAQCNPKANNGAACTRDKNNRFLVAQCTEDFELDLTNAITCSGGCIQGVCQ